MDHLSLLKTGWSLACFCRVQLGENYRHAVPLFFQLRCFSYKPRYTPEIDRWWRKPLSRGMDRVLRNKVRAAALRAAHG
jgi:hypothetical protein